MWFKQLQVFSVTSPTPTSAEILAARLAPLAFHPCLPTMPSSMGWVQPIDEEDAPLAVGVNGCLMMCLQIEEKILPASVINEHVKEKVKQVESKEARKVRHKEKLSLKEELIFTLLPRAFSKFTKVYGYIDTRNQWLLVNTVNPKRVEAFLTMIKKSLGDGFDSFDLIKPAHLMTAWLKTKDYPAIFAIEKSCVLRDPNQQNRVIRCQQQDLFVESIQSIVKDGCEVIQLALTWHDRISFVLAEDFTLRSIGLTEEDMVELTDELETKQQRFTADFVMMIEMFTNFITDLLGCFRDDKNNKKDRKLALVV
jgi:recombination associated protein RdgC